jgi:hypothetical protein
MQPLVKIFNRFILFIMFNFNAVSIFIDPFPEGLGSLIDRLEVTEKVT